MADPLSIAASIITVIGTADAIGKALSKVKTVRNAPAEVLAFNNEVSDVRIVLEDVSFCISDVGEVEATPQIIERLQNLSKLLTRAETELLQVDRILQSPLIKSGTLEGDLRVSKQQWLRRKSTVAGILQTLRDIRLNIATQLMSITA